MAIKAAQASPCLTIVIAAPMMKRVCVITSHCRTMEIADRFYVVPMTRLLSTRLLRSSDLDIREKHSDVSERLFSLTARSRIHLQTLDFWDNLIDAERSVNSSNMTSGDSCNSAD